MSTCLKNRVLKERSLSDKGVGCLPKLLLNDNGGFWSCSSLKNVMFGTIYIFGKGVFGARFFKWGL